MGGRECGHWHGHARKQKERQEDDGRMDGRRMNAAIMCFLLKFNPPVVMYRTKSIPVFDSRLRHTHTFYLDGLPSRLDPLRR